jgi:hypothetical protein
MKIRHEPQFVLPFFNGLNAGPYYPLGTVPGAYDIFRPYEGTEGRKIKRK